MKTILNQLFAPLLSGVGLYSSDNNHRRSGICYRPDPSVGEGYFWVYPVDNLFAVTVYDAVFKENIAFGYRHPAFLSIGTYASPMANLMYEGISRQKESLLGYVGRDEVYEEVVQKGVPLRCVGISLLNDFWNELSRQYSRDFERLPDHLSLLCGADTIPEARTVLRQLQAADPAVGIARAYYEGKVLELLSLVMQWGETRRRFPSGSDLKDWELDSLQGVSACLKRRLADPPSLPELARLACMSQSKLTQAFRRLYGMSVTEYLQSLRMEKAKELLRDSTREIRDIANEMGYRLHRSFSEAFKESTGFTPSEFRRLAL